jgi:hypothetical protein
MARTKKEDKIKIKVCNTEIVVGNTYELVHKIDRDAPAPKNATPTAKLPIPRNGEKRTVPFNDNTKRWDTGFDIASPCNRHIPKTEVDALVSTYVKHIKVPYEEYMSKNLDATNDDFWMEYNYEIKPGKKYNTEDIQELFDLFCALKQGKVCNPGEKDYDLQRSAVYCVKSRQEVTSAEDDKLFKKAEAVSTFLTLLDSSKLDADDPIITMLEWVGFSSMRDVKDKDAIKRQVLKTFDSEKEGQMNVERFLEAYAMSKDESKMELMEMFSMLSKLRAKNRLEYKRQQFYLDSLLLGNTLKDAAAGALNNPDKKEAIIEAFEKINK